MSVRGLAILVRNKYNCDPEGRASPFWLFVRVNGGDLTQPFIVGTVYIPLRLNCAQIFRLLPGTLASLEAAHLDIPVVLTGDFNMELHSLQLEMSSWPTPFQAMDNEGSKATRHGAHARQIDHFACRGSLWGRPPPIPRVLDHWDIADQYPVILDLQGIRAAHPQGNTADIEGGRPRRILADPEARDAISRSNRWSILAEELEDIISTPGEDDPGSLKERNEKIAKRWEETCHAVADNLGLHQKKRRLNSLRVSRPVQRAIAKRRRQHRRVQEAGRTHGFTHPITEHARLVYGVLAKSAKTLIRKDQRKHWF